MAYIKNENPPYTEENSEETLKRLEKTKDKIERSSTIVKALGVVLPIAAGFAWQRITGKGGIIDSSFAAFPVVTAVVSTLALYRDALERKIDAVKEKVAGSFLVSKMLSDQKMRLKANEQHYNQLIHNEESGHPYNADLRQTIKDIEKEKKHEAVFSKAADLAKQEGKEKTIGRLMSIVNKHDNGQTFKYMVGGAAQTAYSFITSSIAIDTISGGYPFGVACAAAASVTIPAVVYCAAKAIQSAKREKNADRAFKILEKYTNERA